MKGLAKSVGAAATVLALGAAPGASGQSLRQGLATNGQVGGAAADAAGSQAMEGLNGSPSRRLQKKNRNDDALDVNGSPRDRASNALQVRKDWASAEFRASRKTFHVTNGDRSSAATFHKTLPHDELGQVDPAAFAVLEECVAEGTFDKCEQVPAGDENGFLIQPIGGTAVDFLGPASSAVSVPSAPILNSEELAAQMAEVYWMSLTRDVPFSQYGEDPLTVAAADNLATMPGFAAMNGVAVDSEGRADPQTQLFRSSALGVEKGPMISQLLVKDYTLDSVTITPRQVTYVPGVDYMTDYDEWLHIQNGGRPAAPEAEDTEKRYIRNARDLSRLVFTDTIYSEALRGALVLFQEGAISKGGFNGPYAGSSRQKGFVTFGVSHVMKILGSAEVAQRSSWYQKWNVHLFARPEAVAGTLHNVKYGNLDVDLDTSLLDNDDLLERVATHNAEMNADDSRTYLLSQAVGEGSPSHPSYPAGHAVQNGAFATVLKALVGLDRGTDCFEEAFYPADDGLTLLPYAGDECLTFEGEINKMAVNIAFGRQMCGVHYRMDSEEGLLLGEIVGVRMLQQEVAAFPENEAYEFRLMSGQTIKLEPDGSFYIDGSQCDGEFFMGAHLCYY